MSAGEDTRLLPAALEGFFFPEAPAARLGMLRVLVGLYGTIYLTARLPHWWSYGLDDLDRFHPVGLLTLADTPLLPALYRGLVLAMIALSVPFLLGWRFRITGPLYAGVALWVITHSNSWGFILHTENLFIVHVLLIAFSPAADALSLDARRRALPERRGPQYGATLKLIVAATTLVYFLAAIAKIKNGGWTFVSGESLRNYIAYAAVRKIELGSHASPFSELLLPYPSVFAVLAWGSLLLELFAPLALFKLPFEASDRGHGNGLLGRAFALGIWSFHWGVLALMAIGFFYPLSFVAFAVFFEPEKLLRRPRIRRLAERVFGPQPDVTRGE